MAPQRTAIMVAFVQLSLTVSSPGKPFLFDPEFEERGMGVPHLVWRKDVSLLKSFYTKKKTSRIVSRTSELLI